MIPIFRVKLFTGLNRIHNCIQLAKIVTALLILFRSLVNAVV